MSDRVIARARTNRRVNLRTGAPRLSSPIRETLDAGTEIFVTATVKGDDVGGNDHWYACRGSLYVWTGACEDYQDEPAPRHSPTRRMRMIARRGLNSAR